MRKGCIVKKLTLAVALAAGLACTAQAAPLEIIDAAPAPSVAAPAPHRALVMLQAQASELPEPEVFLMMLVGLCLIGYRASRHSDEKFE